VLELASKSEGIWSRRVVDKTSDAEGSVSLAVYPEGGEQWIAYRDRKSEFMKVALVLDDAGPDPCNHCDPCDPCGGGMEGAISLKSVNPMLVGEALSLEMMLPKPAAVGLELYDVAGRRVAGRAAERLDAGRRVLVWRPDGARPGLYFLRVVTDGQVKPMGSVVLLQ
jgi:hypothetical protein